MITSNCIIHAPIQFRFRWERWSIPHRFSLHLKEPAEMQWVTMVSLSLVREVFFLSTCRTVLPYDPPIADFSPRLKLIKFHTCSWTGKIEFEERILRDEWNTSLTFKAQYQQYTLKGNLYSCVFMLQYNVEKIKVGLNSNAINKAVFLPKIHIII